MSIVLNGSTNLSIEYRAIDCAGQSHAVQLGANFILRRIPRREYKIVSTVGLGVDMKVAKLSDMKRASML